MPGLVKRRLDILPEGKSNWYVVTQYNYTAWPQHNLQDGFKHIWDLCRIVKTNLRRNQGPCVVHCSDSIGRTAFFLAAMKLMDEVDQTKENIDIFNTVFQMRAARMKMVRV